MEVCKSLLHFTGGHFFPFVTFVEYFLKKLEWQEELEHE
jgi:hypothetical protein